MKLLSGLLATKTTNAKVTIMLTSLKAMNFDTSLALSPISRPNRFLMAVLRFVVQP